MVGMCRELREMEEDESSISGVWIGAFPAAPSHPPALRNPGPEKDHPSAQVLVPCPRACCCQGLKGLWMSSDSRREEQGLVSKLKSQSYSFNLNAPWTMEVAGGCAPCFSELQTRMARHSL